MIVHSQDLQDYLLKTVSNGNHYKPCFYGFCLLRILHMISAMLSKFPTKRILIGKTDLDAAYLRINAKATTALTCITILDKLAFLFLLLPFGTTLAPADYTTVSEVAIDL